MGELDPIGDNGMEERCLKIKISDVELSSVRTGLKQNGRLNGKENRTLMVWWSIDKDMDMLIWEPPAMIPWVAKTVYKGLIYSIYAIKAANTDS